uniref:Uncharacterized protein n=1 Tax=Eutreptiella gymnastica TaxID=73025 RepID=A0A6T2DQC1_9EUGL
MASLNRWGLWMSVNKSDARVHHTPANSMLKQVGCGEREAGRDAALPAGPRSVGPGLTILAFPYAFLEPPPEKVAPLPSRRWCRGLGRRGIPHLYPSASPRRNSDPARHALVPS